jgi:hypothetical protein
MTRLTRALAALALLAAALPARAADRALVADFDKDLSVDGDHYDERAVLAALLARPAESAAFDAQARAALPDPVLRKLFTQAWRAKLAAYADTASHMPDVDQSKSYRNWGEIMTPEQRAYTEARMLSMSAENRDKLVYYLKKLNDDLAASGGKIDQGFLSIDKRIVSGITDQYRIDLKAYAATPMAADGRAHGAAAAAQLAQDLSHAAIASEPLAPPAKTPAPVPARKPATATPAPVVTAPPRLPAPAVPTLEPPPTPTPSGASGALAQAQAADRAGAASGTVFDGGTPAGQPGAVSGSTVGGATGAVPGTLAPSNGAAPSGLTAAPPPSPSASAAGDDDFMKRVEGMGSGQKPSFGYAKWIGAGLLGLIGGLIGFLVGGPVGAAVGAAIGAAAGYAFTAKLISKFT